jgi:hypothetical protein
MGIEEVVTAPQGDMKNGTNYLKRREYSDSKDAS